MTGQKQPPSLLQARHTVEKALWDDGDVAEADRALLGIYYEAHDVREALETACDVAIWMSGASSFSPEGEAHEGWIKQRERLFTAMRVLRRGN